MPREKEAYRDNLVRLNEAFPDRDMLTIKEVAHWMGRDVKTVKKYIPFKKGIGISKATLASILS